MASSVEDLEAVFGDPLDPARAARLAAMDAGNRWDYPFMLLYGAFIASFFAAAARATGRRRWLGAAALGVVAACADGVENLILLGLTKDLEAAPHLGLLPYPVWTKFFALMAAGIAAGTFLLRQPGNGWRVAGGIVVLGALAVVPGFLAPEQVGWVVGNGIGAAWIAQLAWALARSR